MLSTDCSSSVRMGLAAEQTASCKHATPDNSDGIESPSLTEHNAAACSICSVDGDDTLAVGGRLCFTPSTGSLNMLRPVPSLPCLTTEDPEYQAWRVRAWPLRLHAYTRLRSWSPVCADTLHAATCRRTTPASSQGLICSSTKYVASAWQCSWTMMVSARPVLAPQRHSTPARHVRELPLPPPAGTLTPIVNHPDLAFMTEQVRLLATHAPQHVCVPCCMHTPVPCHP